MPALIKVRRRKLFDETVQSSNSIVCFVSDFFTSLIKGETSPIRVELASFLMSRNTKFIPTYIKYVLQNEKSLKNREAVFKILASMPEDDIQPQFLTKLGELYKDEILGWFKDPETVELYVKKNVKAALRLIETVIGGFRRHSKNLKVHFCKTNSQKHPL